MKMENGLRGVSGRTKVPPSMSTATLSPAVFIDRDGTLMEEAHYCGDPALVKIIPGVPEGLRALKNAGYRLVIITNQSGIGRGYYSHDDYHAVQARLFELMGSDLVEATYFCPEPPEANSPRRKPSPAMVHEAAGELGLDLARSWFIGDKTVDVQCGLAAGVRPILVETGYGKKADATGAEFVAKDFATAADYILKTSDA